MTKSDLAKTYLILAGDMETTAILAREHQHEKDQTISDALDFVADRLRDRADVIETEILGGGV